MGLVRDRIIAASDLPSIDVHVDQWNCDVTLRTLNAGEVRELTHLYYRDGKITDQWGFSLAVLVRCMINGNGERIFSNKETTLLAEKNPKVIDDLAARAIMFSGLGETKESEEDDIEKNSETIPAGNSSSG